MTKISIEIDEKYLNSLEALKAMIGKEDWTQVTENWEAVEALIDIFISMINEQHGWHDCHHDWEDGCCHGEWKGEEWCCKN